jgi:hypothetical protein
VLALALASGCLSTQRPAEKLIDPRLREHATLLTAARGRELVFDRYRSDRVTLIDEPLEPGLLPADARGRPTQQQRLRTQLRGGETIWSIECIVQRRLPPDGDFAAAADETRDEVALACQISGDEQRWRLELGGVLGFDLNGSLRSVDARDQPVELQIELQIWYQLLKAVRRTLPTPLVQIRGELAGRRATWAAMIFGQPERVWFERDLVASQGEPLLAALIALRVAPLGLE